MSRIQECYDGGTCRNEDYIEELEATNAELVKVAELVLRAQWLLDNATPAEAMGVWVKASELAQAAITKVRGEAR